MISISSIHKARIDLEYMQELLTPLLACLVVTLLITSITFQPVMPSRIKADAALVALADMVPAQITYSRLLGSVDAQRSIALSVGLRPQAIPYRSHIEDRSITDNSYDIRDEQQWNTSGPVAADYSALAHFLQEQSFKLTRTYTHRLLLDFSGTVAQVERAFHVTLHMYSGPDGRSFYANDSNPLIPARFAGKILAINGLDDALHWRSDAHTQRLLPTQAQIVAGCPGHDSQYITPDQFASAYNLNGLYRLHYSGTGQTIALFELSSFAQSDLSTYTMCFGASHAKIQTIRTGAVTHDDGALEAEMDAELVLSAAPHLATLKIYESGNDATSYLSQWARIIQDNPPVVSISWGLCEQTLNRPFVQEENALFARAVEQRESIFASTGDTGSAGCLGNKKSSSSMLNINDPAAQPFVTSVGGTSLTLKRNSAYSTESTWNTSSALSTSYSGASGGGISRYWTRPWWQQGVKNGYSTGKVCAARAGEICRETPDVSLQADTSQGYIIYCSARATKTCSNSTPWNVVGGTSVATPLWAVLAALANEMQHSRIGFINPRLYQIAANKRLYHACFHDVIRGNNDYNSLNHGRYPASPGYDMATGLGSYNAASLLQTLIPQTRMHHSPNKIVALSLEHREESI